ncbi:hypothetical protein [Facklamia sp. P12955]|uniref:hypothetical protein n=1 Tax=Facklamia sp. P12955 TaxID=3421946 RepID=UPI003D1772FA
MAFLFLGLFLNPNTRLYAEDRTIIEGKVYEQENVKNYDLSRNNSIEANSELETIGQFFINGDVNDQGDNHYHIQKGNLSFFYELNKSKITDLKNQWQVIEDKSTKIGKLKLEKPIMKGTIIVQSSFDGKDWQTDQIITDILSEEMDFSKPFFTTNDIQQINGTFYRILVTYKLERASDPTDLIIFDIENTETKYQFEEYKFYAIDQKTVEDSNASPKDKPRKEFKEKVKIGRDTGYDITKAELIDTKDPHFGWDLGYFTINGYTREAKQIEGKPVFLKTIGDDIKLWFTLNQDINRLDNNPVLSISEDTNGYDVAMGIKPTNFKHGTLIVKYTDDEGHSFDPVIYTDFLAANASTRANTRIQIYQEGDYEVTLNYEIINNPRKILSVDVLPSYTNYKINFAFSIRNGNTMAFPRDIESGAELKDGAYTDNGFTVDFTQSKYLTLDVVRKEITKNDDGSVSSSIRSNTVGNGKNTYDKPGIYELTVKNKYSDSAPTTITIFVGKNRYIAALAKNQLSIEELNKKLLAGREVNENGDMVDKLESDIRLGENSEITELSPKPSDGKNPKQKIEETKTFVKVEENKSNNAFIVLLAIVSLMIALWVVIKRRNNEGE